MATLSRPVGYGGFAVVAGALLWWTYSQPEPLAKHVDKKAPVAKKSEVDWEFPATPAAQRFDKPEVKMRNIFMPLYAIDKTVLKNAQDEIMNIPANLAGGEGNWAYTGMVEVDGVRMALLENNTSHQAGYVKEGDTWKKSRITHITTASIVVVGQDGSEETVFRFNANQQPKPKPLPDAGFRPVDLTSGLKGPIGDIQITPMKSSPISGSATTK